MTLRATGTGEAADRGDALAASDAARRPAAEGPDAGGLCGVHRRGHRRDRPSGALLVGERANRKTIKRVHDVIVADPAVERVGDLLTMQLGPEQVLLTVDIKFRKGLDVPQLESAIDRIEGSIRNVEPMIQRIFIEAESFTQNPKSSSRAA